VAVTGDQFRSALGLWPSGVSIVTAEADGTPVGMTVSAFFSVSLSPPLVGVCLSEQSGTLDAVIRQRAFGVSVLERRQAHLSERFSLAGNEPVRFVGVALTALEGQRVPVLDGALMQLSCRLVEARPAGDHRLCIGEVLAHACHSGEPLVFHASGYHRLELLGEAEAEADV
jgi:flavin reductase (DIM6/NTAB) family NADH-FMN oxidoreductase RutF